TAVGEGNRQEDLRARHGTAVLGHDDRRRRVALVDDGAATRQRDGRRAAATGQRLRGATVVAEVAETRIGADVAAGAALAVGATRVLHPVVAGGGERPAADEAIETAAGALDGVVGEDRVAHRDRSRQVHAATVGVAGEVTRTGEGVVGGDGARGEGDRAGI